MIDWAEIVRRGLELPATDESPWYGRPALRC
jgi:hypothetical protein